MYREPSQFALLYLAIAALTGAMCTVRLVRAKPSMQYTAGAHIHSSTTVKHLTGKMPSVSNLNLLYLIPHFSEAQMLLSHQVGIQPTLCVVDDKEGTTDIAHFHPLLVIIEIGTMAGLRSIACRATAQSSKTYMKVQSKAQP